MATTIDIISRPGKERDSVTVNWLAAHNPVPFTFQRYDFAVTNIEIASGTLDLTVATNPESAPFSYVIGDTISIKINSDNVTDGTYVITGFDTTGSPTAYIIEVAAVDAALASEAATSSYLFKPSSFLDTRLVVSIFDNSTSIEITNITIFHFTNGEFLFDLAPFVKSLLSNTNANPYTANIYTDTNASKAVYLKYQLFYTGGSDSQIDDVANTYYLAQGAKQIGDTYGQNYAAYVGVAAQTSVMKFLGTQVKKKVWRNYPFSLSAITNAQTINANITQKDNAGTELSNNDDVLTGGNVIEQITEKAINASAKSIEITLNDKFNAYSMLLDGVDERFIIGNGDIAAYELETFTIMAWFKITSLSDFTVFGIQGFSGITPAGCRIYIESSGNIGASCVVGTNSNETAQAGAATVTTGTWYHAAITKSGTSLILYIDGVSAATKTLSTSTMDYTAPSLRTYIGCRNNAGSPGFFFDGNIDEVAVFNTALSPANISTIGSTSPISLTPYSPLGWWRMGEEGTYAAGDWTLTDQGSGGNNATSVNMEEADRVSDVAS